MRVGTILMNSSRSPLAHGWTPARAAESRSVTPEVAEAFSWIARGELDAKRYDRAQVYAAETRKLSDALLRTRRLDAEHALPIALGASIEVHAQALAATGERAEAVSFLREQAKLFGGTSIVERIRKNLNLLDMTGKPAPELNLSDWIGTKPSALARLRGVAQRAVADYLASRGALQAEAFTAERFVLYSARDGTVGGPYVVEAAYPLG